MIRLVKLVSLFLWVLGPMAAYGVYSTYGLPHIPWSYTFYDNGDAYNPWAKRHYLTCTFIGWYGTFTVPAKTGRCDWVRFFKEGADQ